MNGTAFYDAYESGASVSVFWMLLLKISTSWRASGESVVPRLQATA